ncbi:FAD-dependent oxidoreductase [Paracoccus spongiarum]|uniref:FAD-dependent oxidoreductase n=1 Tax=Paracoccus spongiarum TaxID=3064387 RepID=A0ABT9JEQ5_9RHOB|nr:FAD-dependent oxidoreductase [Paracoccus sp. 2205BS29-5]MDP5308308.1 FAD-dependent oxidoreductase [Paracoccus sp. 2205BS29-5]
MAHAPSAAADLVLIGGGHSHALLLRRWGQRPAPAARLTLVTPHTVAEYSGMLPGHVAGLYDRREIEIDLARLAHRAGARLILDRATGLDLRGRRVMLAGGAPLAFDLASVDIGVEAGAGDVPGLADHGLPVKPAARFLAGWQRFADTGGGALAIIGGGVAGIEIALAARRRLPNIAITVIEAAPAMLRELSPRARRLVLARARSGRIALVTGRAVARVGPEGLWLRDGGAIPARLVVAATGGQVGGWLGRSGLAMQGDRMRVDATLRSSHPAVFGVGDCAVLAGAPRPQAGVFAVRQAPVLDHNLRAALAGTGRMRAYRPQRDWLRLIAAGGDAVADKWGIALGGPWVWRWKDRIDRRFMAMLSDPPRRRKPGGISRAP